MPVSIRIKPMDKTALFQPGGALHPDTAARMIADYARKEIAAAERINAEALGRPAPKRTFTNGIENAPFESVKPGNSIVALFDLGSDAVRVIYDMLRAHAPVLKGKFKDSIKIYADGSEVSGPESIGNAREIIFLSTVPYARKIEGNKRAGKKAQSSQAPDGVFEAVAALAKQRFSNLAAIKFEYNSPVGGAPELDAWARKNASKEREAFSREIKKGKNKGQIRYYNPQRTKRIKNMRQPSIRIVLR